MMAAALLPRLGKNSLVLLAEHDEATDNETTIRALGKAAVPFKTIPGTKHGMQFDAPEAVVSELTRFLDPVEV
jgi:pimeloyl-ACP methyl ester carboxylesterase